MIEFDPNTAAALLGYLTLLVGFGVFGSAGLAFVQSLLRRQRNRNEPVKHRIPRMVSPANVEFRLGADGHLTDLVEYDAGHHVVAEFHVPRPQRGIGWILEDDDDSE